jgi:hypothetical protein
MTKLGVVSETVARQLDAAFVDFVKSDRKTGLEPYYLTENGDLSKGARVLLFRGGQFKVVRVTQVVLGEVNQVRVADDKVSWRADGYGSVLA